jgi:CHAT domain-containing protein
MRGDFPGARAAAGRAAASTERERGPGSPEALEARGVEARILFDSGDYGRALAAARSALKAAGEGPALPPAALEAEISLAGVLDALGSGSEALEILTAAWLEALYADGPDSRPYLAARAAAADVLIGAGDFIAARRILEEVLLARKISSGERAQETLEALSSWGRVNARMGDWAAAEAAFREALEARREALGPARPRALESLVSLAGAVAAQGRGDEAKALLLEALTGLESALGSGHPRTAEAAAALGEICLLEGELSAAAFYLKVAVSADQRTRGGLLALDRVLQDGYLVSVRRHYDLLVKALLLSGKAAEAQEVIGLLKEAETRPPWPEETSRKPREAPPSAAAPPGGRDDGTLFAGTADEAARRAFREAADTLSAMGRERAALAGRKRAGELDEAGEARLSEIDARLSEASREFLDLCGSLRERLSAAGEQGKVKAVELLESRQRTLEAMGEGTVLVHALSTEDSLYLFLTTPYALAVKESPVPRQELSAMATRLAALLRDGSRDPRPAAKALWDVLMAPIEGELEGAGARTLMFSLDGPLRYVPVAALWDGERWLAERHPTALFTEASLDKLRDGPASAPRAMALGVTREVGGLPKLDCVAGEIAAVVGDAAAGPSGDGRPAPSFGAGAAEGAAGALPGEAFLDEDFTAERLSGCLSSGADVVHVASHFSFDGLDRWDSFLLLGDGSRLSLRSIRSERAYDFAGLDLLTLSACDTASGIAGGNGSELESFGDTVLLKGAMAVLASLWPVGDESTAALMREFYRLRYLEGLDKAAALQGAQLSLMKGEAGPSSQAAPRRGPVSAVPLREAEDAPPWTGTGFTHPVHWAPFIVMGNWR